MKSQGKKWNTMVILARSFFRLVSFLFFCLFRGLLLLPLLLFSVLLTKYFARCSIEIKSVAGKSGAESTRSARTQMLPLAARRRRKKLCLCFIGPLTTRLTNRLRIHDYVGCKHSYFSSLHFPLLDFFSSVLPSRSHIFARKKREQAREVARSHCVRSIGRRRRVVNSIVNSLRRSARSSFAQEEKNRELEMTEVRRGKNALNIFQDYLMK